MTHEPFIQKLTLRNFRSIRNETVTFANPLFLVGRNGSGKSNFVDALAFLSECMTGSLQSVIEKRGGVGRVGYLRTPLDAPYISFRVDFRRDEGSPFEGFYAFQLVVMPDRKYEVARERCELTGADDDGVWFDRIGSQIRSSVPGIQFAASPRSLVMPIIGGVQDFAPVYQSLAAMRVYKIEPDRISDIQYQDDEAFLRSDGSNIGSVLQRLSKQEGQLMRVGELLRAVVPGIAPTPSDFSNGKSALFFEQQWPTIKTVFEAAAMSRGTLSTLGLAVVALQEPTPSVVAIEEPELYIHPGALEAISDIINIAAQRAQVIITTHSPDLLDTKWITPENLRVVEWEDGATNVSELGEAPIKALRQHLMGAGELLRADALDAAPFVLPPKDVFDVFGGVTA